MFQILLTVQPWNIWRRLFSYPHFLLAAAKRWVKTSPSQTLENQRTKRLFIQKMKRSVTRLRLISHRIKFVILILQALRPSISDFNCWKNWKLKKNMLRSWDYLKVLDGVRVRNESILKADSSVSYAASFKLNEYLLNVNKYWTIRLDISLSVFLFNLNSFISVVLKGIVFILDVIQIILKFFLFYFSSVDDS